MAGSYASLGMLVAPLGIRWEAFQKVNYPLEGNGLNDKGGKFF
jgi:hypothetical protein